MNNFEVYTISTTELELEDSSSTDSSLKEKSYNNREIATHIKLMYQEIELGNTEKSQTVLLYKEIQGKELQEWTQFFRKHKSTFAWTYADLKGIPKAIGEHHITLEPNAIPIRQRQHRLNPKYS